MRPVTETGSPLMKERTLVRQLGVHEVPLSKLREAAHRSGGSLNDAFVAGVAGGLRRYHDKHGVPIGDLHLTMPISLRKEDDDMGGNRITLMRFDVPVGIADPAERISQIRERTAKVRNEKSTALHPDDRRCAEPDAALVHRLDAAPRRLPVPATCPACRSRCTSAAQRCGCSTRSARPSARRSTSRC